MGLFKSEYSVYEIWQKRQKRECEMQDDVHELQFLMLYKGFDQKVWVSKLENWQYDLVSFLHHQDSIEDALAKTVDLHRISEVGEIQSFFCELGSYPIISRIL